jgi:hypothetical protein
MQQPTNTAQLQILNNIVASLALAQAAAKLSEVGMSARQNPAAAAPPLFPTMSSGTGTDSSGTSSSAVPNFSTGCIGGGMILAQQGDRNLREGVPHIQPLQNEPQRPLQNEQQRLVLNQLLKGQHQLSLPIAEQEKKEKDVTVPAPAPSLAMGQHAKQLKAAFEEQQRALRLAYEKTLQEAEELERRSTLGDAVAGSATLVVSSTETTAGAGIRADGSSNLLAKATTPAEQLQRSYEAHLASLQQSGELHSLHETKLAESKTPSARSPPMLFPDREQKPGKNISSNDRIGVNIGKGGKGSTVDAAVTKLQSSRKPQDEEAGTILLGFLNSLRESYVDAVESKDDQEAEDPPMNLTKAATVDGKLAMSTSSAESKRIPSRPPVAASGGGGATKNAKSGSRRHVKRSRDSCNPTKDLAPEQDGASMQAMSRFPSSHQCQRKPATVTEASSGTSSQPTTEQSSSSLEDSDSKSDKTDQFSSEESSEEKDQVEAENRSKGPPRKRLKSYDSKLHEFTRENLLEHSKRMDLEHDSYGGASGTNCD